MNILLIQPKMLRRPMDSGIKARMSPSLALLTLKALTPAEHRVVMVNENLEALDCRRVKAGGGFFRKAYFGAEPADLAAITVTVDVLPRAAAIAAELRRLGVPVVAGGIHITACPEACSSYFDTLCLGPAERVWAKLLEDAGEKRLLPRYSDYENFSGREIRSPDYAAALQDPRYLYANVVSTSRGCPHQCDFCYNSCAGSVPYVNRPIPHVLADIAALGTRHVMFVDDNFIGNPGWTRQFLLELRGMGLTWHAAVTTRVLHHPDLLDLAAETGCQSLFIGFESVNQDSLAAVHKHNRVSEYSALVQAIHSRGMMVNASLVFGLDGDDETSFDTTLAWLVKNRIETVTAHIMTPYPGTALHRELGQAGRITCGNLAHYNTAHVVFRPAGMDPATLQKGYLKFYKRFYSVPNIIRRIPRQPGQRLAYLLFNLLYRKYGRLTSALSQLVPLSLLGKLAAHVAYRPNRRTAPKAGARSAGTT